MFVSVFVRVRSKATKLVPNLKLYASIVCGTRSPSSDARLVASVPVQMAGNMLVYGTQLVALLVSLKAVNKYMIWCFPPHGVPGPAIAPDSYSVGGALVFFAVYAAVNVVCYALV